MKDLNEIKCSCDKKECIGSAQISTSPNLSVLKFLRGGDTQNIVYLNKENTETLIKDLKLVLTQLKTKEK
jgi:hypothetical protein